jgi:O-antigen/teichoic acid export membrane protein
MTIARDTAYNLAGAVAPAIFMLAVTPFYLNEIGPDRFGILAICWTIVGALGFASVGMGPALAYRLALMDGEAPADRSNHVWMALLISFAASLVGALLLVAIGLAYFQQFASLPSRLKEEIWRALPFLAIMLPVGTLSGVLNGALQGRKRFDALGIISVLNAALTAITPLAAAMFVGATLPILILAMVTASALVLFAQLTTTASVVPLWFPPHLARQHAKQLVGFGAWMSATALIAPFLLLFDRFVVAALRGPGAVAVYVLAFNILQALLLLPASLSSAILPRLAPMTREVDVRQLQSNWLIWLNGVLTPVVVTAIALSAPFFRLWVGPTLGSAASPVAAILLVGCWLHGIAHIPATVLIGGRRPDIVTKLLLACLAPYVPLLYVATLHFGVIGAAAIWTLRAGCDEFLFLFTRPYRADIRSLATSAVVVLGAMVTAVSLEWTSALYWAAMALITIVAFYQNRAVLISSISEFRKLALGTN